MFDPRRKRALFGAFILLACLVITVLEVVLFAQGLGLLSRLLPAP
jgi:hypothetical protein